MASVIIENVSKRFGGGAAAAVADLSLAVRDHEFMSFLGPSGCGKTTTLNMIAGLEHPTSGSIRIGTREVTTVPASRRDVAMVFQSYALYPHMTVAANLGFALRVRGLDKPAIEAAVRRTADRLSLGEFLGRYPRQLSGGQRQRVALGRALVRDPEVFLLDEPLSNLDAVLRVQTRAEMKRLFASLGTTAIYVTHDQAEAMTMSDRVAIFDRGRLQQVGSPLEIYRAPVNRFVASFVGAPPMTLLPGVIGERDITFAGIAVPAPSRLGGGQGNRPVLVGLRAEDLQFAPDGAPAEVELVEHLGSAVILHLTLGGATVVALRPESATHRPGEAVSLHFDPEKLYLFDPADGQAIITPGAASYPEPPP